MSVEGFARVIEAVRGGNLEGQRDMEESPRSVGRVMLTRENSWLGSRYVVSTFLSFSLRFKVVHVTNVQRLQKT